MPNKALEATGYRRLTDTMSPTFRVADIPALSFALSTCIFVEMGLPFLHV